MSTYFVTGGAGFIGSNYLFYLREKHPGARIVCIDSLTYAGNYKTLKPFESDPDFRFVCASVSDEAAMDALFNEERPDYVVHFAAESHVDRSILDPALFMKTNVLGTLTLLNCVNKYKTGRFHQVSTDEVYGDLPIDRPELLFTEQSPIRASSPYSASKASADLVVLAYHRTYGTPVTVSRCSNNYGPYQFPEKLIPLMTINAMNDRPLPVYGQGINVRDWLFVGDHCAAIDLILHHGRVGEVYNIGGRAERRNIDIVRQIVKALGKPESLITFVKDRAGHDLRYAIDFSKLHNELGWSPTVSFEEGLLKTVDWYRENEAWWQDIVNGDYKDYYQKMYGTEGNKACPANR